MVTGHFASKKGTKRP